MADTLTCFATQSQTKQRGENNSFRPVTSSLDDSSTCEGRKSPKVFAPPNSSWRVRAESHYSNILELLRTRCSAGVRSDELYNCPEKYGRSPRNRISEMRAKGFKIRTEHINSSTVLYVLDEGPRDWYEEQIGQRRAPVVPHDSTTDDLPLFPEVCN